MGVIELCKNVPCFDVCGSKRFYVKDPNEAHDTYSFDLEAGGIVFSEDVDESECPEIDEETRTHCEQCAWNGWFGELAKACTG